MGAVRRRGGNQIVARARSDLFEDEGEFVDFGYTARWT
jgi:hypothetical protein